MSGKAVKVFISYAHDGDEHSARVAELAARLRKDGVEATIDQYVEHTPPIWPKWMAEQVEDADFVLCVLSATYKARFECDEEAPGRGVKWEGAVITEETYRSLPHAHRKFIAVAFERNYLDEGPRALFPASRTSYCLWADYDDLYRRLTAQGAEVPVLGEVRTLPPRPVYGSETAVGDLIVHSRPPFALATYRDRVEQTRMLAERVRARGGTIVITGRAGIGKTALVGRLLEMLEATQPPPRLHVAYLSAAGTAPLTPDLVAVHLCDTFDQPHPEPAALPKALDQRDRATLLVLDQLENAPPDDPAGLSTFIARLRQVSRVKLVLVSREEVPTAVAGDGAAVITLSDGLPDEDAKALLVDADPDGRLGLRDAPAETMTALLDLASGYPRVLELMVGALLDDPLLSPSTLCETLFRAPDPIVGLLEQSYAGLDEDQTEVLCALAACGRPMPLRLLGESLPRRRDASDSVRQLARRHLVKIDRIGQRIWIDRVDVGFVLHFLLDDTGLRATRERVAHAALDAVARGDFKATEADSWVISAIDHLVAASLATEAAALLSGPLSDRIELHGLYDQLIRLHEAVSAIMTPTPAAAARLLRLYTLRGDIEGARRSAERAQGQLSADTAASAELLVEYADLLANTDDPRGALRSFRRGHGSTSDAFVKARASIGAAQVLRRRGALRLAKRCLEAALAQLQGQPETAPERSHLQALALHHIAGNARFEGESAAARVTLDEALRISKEAEDRGGEAYRLCLGAAIDSDCLAVDDAAHSVQRALGLYDEIGDEWGKAAASYALAALLADLGDYDGALRTCRTAESLSTKTHNTRVSGLLPAVELACARRSGDTARRIEEALTKCRRSEKQLRRSGMRFYADLLCLAVVLHLRVQARPTDADAKRVATAAGARILRTWNDLAPSTEEEACRLLRPFFAASDTESLPTGLDADVKRLVSDRTR